MVIFVGVRGFDVECHAGNLKTVFIVVLLSVSVRLEYIDPHGVGILDVLLQGLNDSSNDRGGVPSFCIGGLCQQACSFVGIKGDRRVFTPEVLAVGAWMCSGIFFSLVCTERKTCVKKSDTLLLSSGDHSYGRNGNTGGIRFTDCDVDHSVSRGFDFGGRRCGRRGGRV